jgi:hypothetical protein
LAEGSLNRIHCGEIKHKGNAYLGQHEAIIDPDLWQVVQDKLATNRQERAFGVGPESPNLLAGLIADAEGQRLTPTHANKRGERYRYYISASLLDGKSGGGQGTFQAAKLLGVCRACPASSLAIFQHPSGGSCVPR